MSRTPIKRNQFTRRRLRSVLAVVAALALIAWSVRLLDDNLQNSSWSTGYLLFGMVVFLAAFGVRKKLSVLPGIGSAASWMQFHIYVGLASFFVFGCHIHWRIPTGAFESLLATVFLLVGGSGVYGLYLTRALPRKLTALRQQVIFEQIPVLRDRLAVEARQLLLANESPNPILARYYVNRGAAFMEQPRHWWFYLAPSSRRCKQMVAEIRGLDRYLATSQRETSARLMQLLREKDDLDYHWAVQGQLKVWLFAHISLTCSLLVMAAFHLVVVHAFGGGLR